FLSDLLRAPKAEDPPQSSLFKVSLDVGPPKASRLLSWVGPLKTLGVILEPFGPGAVALTLPVDLDGPGAVAWVEELLAHPPAADEELISSSARTLACRAAGHAVRHLHLDRAAALFRRVEAADHRIPCRHGRVVVFEISYLELEGRAR
ncbi:MAG TPA: hypothetical protein VEY30_02975, partial [Myxococcaceae bacterium]|nr:hypothetical protein [Myxococcaceae bacterium]